jgi:double-strand break repair protein MRE11
MTKLALYGLSNVRDERLFRTFRDGNVTVYQPTTQKGDWFNLMSVHQNHHAYTETGYLPESFLPEFMDLVVWGHEHECLIDPTTNPEMGFKVMQPGSSVATSLVKGEAVAKHIAIVTIRGKEFDVETIRLKTVRPFKYREITLADDRAMRDLAHAQDGAPKVHQYLMGIVDEMIEEAKEEWLELQQEDTGEDQDEELEPPLPLIRLRVDYTPPEGGAYHLDNPQRFSNRFVGRVANQTDVVQFHRKRAPSTRATKNQPDMPDADAFAEMSLDRIKVEKLVQEFLTAQSLTILPQHTFSDAVGQFVDKDDKSAMGQFIHDSLESQVAAIMADGGDDVDDDAMADVMEKVKEKIDKAFAKGELKRSKQKGTRKPKPDGWDSDMDGAWEDNPASIVRDEDEMVVDDEDEDESPTRKVASRRGRGRVAKNAATSTRKTATTKKAPAKSTGGRGRKKQVSEDEDDDEDEDVIMLDDDDEEDEDDEEEDGLFVTQAETTKKKAPPSKTSRSTAVKAAPAKAPPAKTSTRGSKAASIPRGQTQLSFASQANGSASSRSTGARAAAPKKLQEPSEDEISDDDAFEAPPAAATRSARTSRR